MTILNISLLEGPRTNNIENIPEDQTSLLSEQLQRIASTENQTTETGTAAGSNVFEDDPHRDSGIRKHAVITLFFEAQDGHPVARVQLVPLQARPVVDKDVATLDCLTAEGAGFYSGRLVREITGRWSIALEDQSGQWRLYGHWLTDVEKAQRLAAGSATEPAEGR